MDVQRLSLSLSAEEYDRLVNTYETGKDLSQEETDYLRGVTSRTSWDDMVRMRAASLRKPAIDALKAQFPEGSVVYLKTGSPKLIVEWTRDDGIISVVWFNGDAANRDSFHPCALVKELV